MLVLVALFPLIAAVSARANLIVTFAARDNLGRDVTGDVVPGSKLEIDILLSVDGDDDPLSDVRSIALDFSESDPMLVLDAITWQVDQAAYGFLVTDLPKPSATSLAFSSQPGLLVLDGTPQVVAILDVTVNGAGVLDAGFGPGGAAKVSADFNAPVEFTGSGVNVSGGTLALTVPGGTTGGGMDGGAGDGTGGDADGDGVADAQDAFPNDPTETVDTDGDGVGDNADAFPNDPTESADTDMDGIGDVADPDADGDGVPNTEDAFPTDPTETVDTDGDGVGDVADAFPTDPAETTDTDGDSVGDNADAFPMDPNQTTLGGSNANVGPVAAGGFCGMGMLGGMVWIMGGLLWVRRRHAWRGV